MRIHIALLVTFIAMPAAAAAHAQAPVRGILGRAAPAWEVSEWRNLPDGRKRLDVADYRGKVLYLYCFQSWCPGCHKHGFPTLKSLVDQYGDDPDVAFVAVQTTFEGFSSNTATKGWATVRGKGLTIPVGQSGSRNKRSELMRRYRTGGTPWTIIIDPEGVVRYNDFHIRVDQAQKVIEKYRPGKTKAKGAKRVALSIETLPEERGGQDVVGTTMPTLNLDGWRGTPGDKPLQHTGKVTLYRWWTDTCPYCASSLPAFEKLRRKYESKGLQVVGVYHPKPPRDVSAKTIQQTARQLGFRGSIAFDLDWSELKRFYLSTGRRPATSVSFLVDTKGVIRFVHPGPELFPSDDPESAQQNHDYVLLEKAIQTLLTEHRAAQKPVEKKARSAGAAN